MRIALPRVLPRGHSTGAKAKARSETGDRHADWPLISPKLVVVVFLLVSSSVGGYFIYKRVREGGGSAPRPTTSPPEGTPPEGTTPPETTPPSGTPPEGTPPEGTPPQAPPPPGDSNGDSDNTGTLAGAVVGSILGTALLFGVSFAIYSRVKKSTELAGNDRPIPTSEYINNAFANDFASRLSIRGTQEQQERPADSTAEAV